MSITPDEAARDEWYSQLVDEISRDAIAEFQTERLRSYYINNPDVARNAVARYKEARGLLTTHPGAALVLFVTSAEVVLKSVLLKPVIHGLVHNEAVADLVADLAVTQTGLDRFKSLLAKIIETYGEIAFTDFRIEGHKKTLWEELAIIQKARNALVHRAEPVGDGDAALASEVATMVMGNWLPSVLHAFGLQLGKGGAIERV